MIIIWRNKAITELLKEETISCITSRGIFHVIAVSQADLGLAHQTAHASNPVTSERKEQDKAAFSPFRQPLGERRIHASTNPRSR